MFLEKLLAHKAGDPGAGVPGSARTRGPVMSSGLTLSIPCAGFMLGGSSPVGNGSSQAVKVVVDF